MAAVRLVAAVLAVPGVLVRLGTLAMLVRRQPVGGRAVVRCVVGVVVTCHITAPHAQDG
jgi:hypothetical protein